MSALTAAFRIAAFIWRENRGIDRVTYLFSGLKWQIRKSLGKPFVATLSSGARAKIYPASTFSGVFYVRWPERKDVLFLRRQAHLADILVDVGANVGLFSALLFDVFRTFYLFEPAPLSFKALRETCALNPGVECHPINMAVSDREGVIEFIDEGEFSTTSRSPMPSETADSRIVTIPACTLDAVLGAKGDIILKIDVEGMEERVLRGAAELFRRQKVKLALFERLGRTNFDNISAFFASFGYRLFFVTEGGAISVAPDDLQRPLINLFACPGAVFETLR